LEEKRVPRNQVERIIWLHPDALPRGKAAAEEGASSDEASSAPQADDAPSLQAVQRDGICLTFVPAEFAEGSLVGRSPALGECRVDLAQVERLRLGGAIEDAAADHPYAPWRLKPAVDPQYVAAVGGAAAPAPENASPLVGQSAPDFRLDTLGDAKFQLAEARGQVVVLDFWASWCGPCVQAMPQIEEVVEGFAGQGVRLVAVNMQEDAATVAAALERIGVEPEVALDIDGAAAGKYAVTAIPQTVVIDAAGVVRAVLVGGGPLLAENLNSAIRSALEAQPPAPQR
jgi:thiol-disulfide isomerase/thioredoxin